MRLCRILRWGPPVAAGDWSDTEHFKSGRLEHPPFVVVVAVVVDTIADAPLPALPSSTFIKCSLSYSHTSAADCQPTHRRVPQKFAS